MDKDSHLIFESYTNHLSKTKEQLGSNIMRLVKYGMPDEQDVPILKNRLMAIFRDIKKAGGHVTASQSEEAKHIINQLRNAGMPEQDIRGLYKASDQHLPAEDAEDYREQMPDSREEYSAHDYTKETEREGEKDRNANYWMSTFRRTFGPGNRERMIKDGLDPYEFFVDYYEWMKHYDPDILAKYANIYNSTYPDHEVDVEKLVDMFGAIKDKPMAGYKDTRKAVKYPWPGKSEDEERRLDPKCWKGYHKQGTKLKDGVRVNNCVKNK